MKTVTSEGNLSGYFAIRGELDIEKLNHKIKLIKSALKVAERHNEDLHIKLKNQKENHQMQIIQLENQYKKYKELYDNLCDKYEEKSIELKEYKKRLKLVQAGLQAQVEGELLRQMRDTNYRQEKELIHLKEENRILFEQLHEKSAKLKDFEAFVSKNYLHRPPNELKDKSFLANIKSVIESKNDDNQKLTQERAKLLAGRMELERQNSELALKLVKVQTEAEYQRKLGREAKQKTEKLEREVARLNQENRNTATKYQELLNFTYDAQKDMEQQLQVISKEVLRKDHR